MRTVGIDNPGTETDSRETVGSAVRVAAAAVVSLATVLVAVVLPVTPFAAVIRHLTQRTIGTAAIAACSKR